MQDRCMIAAIILLQYTSAIHSDITISRVYEKAQNTGLISCSFLCSGHVRMQHNKSIPIVVSFFGCVHRKCGAEPFWGPNLKSSRSLRLRS